MFDSALAAQREPGDKVWPNSIAIGFENEHARKPLAPRSRMWALVNLAGNKVIGTVSNVSAVVNIGGLLVFAAIAVAASGISLQTRIVPPSGDPSFGTFLGGVALAILAFKGFTTITNAGDEVTEPGKNVGRAILMMDIALHWGVLRHLHQDVGANRVVLGTAIALDIVALGAFLIVKGSSDPLIVAVSIVSVAVVVAFERFYLRTLRATGEPE